MGTYPDLPKDRPSREKATNDPNSRWRELYQAALMELDHDKLLQYIELAEQAIGEQAATRLGGKHLDLHELQAMQDALRALSLLRRNTLRD